MTEVLAHKSIQRESLNGRRNENEKRIEITVPVKYARAAPPVSRARAHPACLSSIHSRSLRPSMRPTSLRKPIRVKDGERFVSLGSPSASRALPFNRSTPCRRLCARSHFTAAALTRGACSTFSRSSNRHTSTSVALVGMVTGGGGKLLRGALSVHATAKIMIWISRQHLLSYLSSFSSLAHPFRSRGSAVTVSSACRFL